MFCVHAVYSLSCLLDTNCLLTLLSSRLNACKHPYSSCRRIFLHAAAAAAPWWPSQEREQQELEEQREQRKKQAQSQMKKKQEQHIIQAQKRERLQTAPPPGIPVNHIHSDTETLMKEKHRSPMEEKKTK